MVAHRDVVREESTVLPWSKGAGLQHGLQSGDGWGSQS